MEFLSQFSESRMFLTTNALQRYTAREAADIAYLHLLALRILLHDGGDRKAVLEYLYRTIRYETFLKWYQNTTDLHLLLHGLTTDFRFKDTEKSEGLMVRLSIDTEQLVRWFRYERYGRDTKDLVSRIFVKIDRQFKIDNSSFIAIRRIVHHWGEVDLDKQQLAMTRLLQLFRTRAPRAEMREMLEKHARMKKLELVDVCNPDTGEGCEDAAKSGMRARVSAAVFGRDVGYRSFREEEEPVSEDATGGATAAAAIAPVVSSLGPIQRRTPKPNK